MSQFTTRSKPSHITTPIELTSWFNGNHQTQPPATTDMEGDVDNSDSGMDSEEGAPLPLRNQSRIPSVTGANHALLLITANPPKTPESLQTQVLIQVSNSLLF